MPRLSRLSSVSRLRPAAWLLEVARDARAQDSFEYLLVLGGVSVALVLAIAAPVSGSLLTGVVDGACATVTSIVPAAGC